MAAKAGGGVEPEWMQMPTGESTLERVISSARQLFEKRKMTEAKYEQLKEMFGKTYADLVRRLVKFGDYKSLHEYLKLRKQING